MADTASVRYQIEHYGDDRGPQIVAGSIIMLIATVVAVTLRLVAQKMIKVRYDWDDWLILIAGVRCIHVHIQATV